MELERVLDSINVDVAKSALAALGELRFFQLYANRISMDLISRFETVPAAERAGEVDKLSAIRSTLLELDAESRLLAEEIKDSGDNKETMNEIAIDS